MNARQRVRDAVQRGAVDELEALVADNPQTLRCFLGLSYSAEPESRRIAARAMATGSRHHPELVAAIVRRLVWAMNDESGTNALTAAELLQAIANARPELLLPIAPDLMRLSLDRGLRAGLLAALRTIQRSCPGQLAKDLETALNRRLPTGERPDAHRY